MKSLFQRSDLTEPRLPSPTKLPAEEAVAPCEEQSKNSPTRVSDFDGIERSISSPPLVEKAQVVPVRSAFRHLAPPDIATTPVTRRSSLPDINTAPVTRRSRSSFNALPTLDETMTSEKDVSTDDFPESVPTFSPQRTKADFLEARPVQGGKGSPVRKQGSRKLTQSELVQELQDKASNLAQTGNEEKALTVYKKALRVSGAEISRIKSQIQQLDAKHPSTVQSIQSRLHEDWVRVGQTIAKIRTVMAILYERQGDYEHAISSCLEAKEIYTKQSGVAEDSALKDKVDKLDQQMEGMIEKIKGAQSSSDARKRRHEEILLLHAKALMTSETEEKKRLYAQLERVALAMRKDEVHSLGETHPQIAETESFLSIIAQEQGDRAQAIAHANNALEINKLSLGPKHPKTGKDFLSLARLYGQSPASKPDEETAVEYYTKAVEIFRQGHECERLVGSTLNDLAVLYIARKDYDEAVSLLSDALETYQSDSLSSKKDGIICCDSVQVWRNLGECYLQRKQQDDAINALVSALDLQRDGRKMFDASLEADPKKVIADITPPTFIDDESIADTLRRLGKAYRAMQRFDEALSVYKEACVIHRLAVAKAMTNSKGKTNPLLPAKQDELAHTLYFIAEVCGDMGQLDESSRIFGESLQLRLFSDAHKGEKRTNMVHCAMCLVGIGGIHFKKQEYDDAVRVYKEALSFCDAHGITESHVIYGMINQKIKEVEAVQSSESKNFQMNVKRLERAAEEEIARGDLSKAVQTLTRVMSIRKATLKELKASGDDTSKEKHATACALTQFGYVLAKQGDYSNAERAYTDALKLFQKIGATSRIGEISMELERIRHLNC